MGQKIHPGGLRVGVIHDWKSNWYTGDKEFAGALLEDVKIREHIYGKLSHAGLSDILIRKDKQRITIDIFTARPGIVIGKSGVEVDALRREIHAMTQKNVHININEIKRPELDAKLVAQSIAEQLQNRVSFRRAMKRSLASALATALRSTFSRSRATAFCVKARIVRASGTLRPRIASATSRAFRAETWTYFACARTSSVSMLATSGPSSPAPAGHPRGRGRAGSARTRRACARPSARR